MEVSKTLIEFVQVSKKFDRDQVLQNINFAVNEGKITTLIGPNGAGKTTIARLLLGLEKPSSGNIIRHTNAIKIGYVPQKSDYNVTVPITTKNFLTLIAPDSKQLMKVVEQKRGFSSLNMHEQSTLEYLMDFVNIESILNKDIANLSGGQLQKLTIVATLLRYPELVVFDEPIQFLDVASYQQFYKLIGFFKESFKTTIFMISHDLFTVMKSSDQVICLNGHICCSGNPNNSTENPELASALASVGFYTHNHDHTH